MTAGTEELAVTVVQFARFASVCRPFAPLYRRRRLAASPRRSCGQDPAPILDLAYGDVLAAWRHYLGNITIGAGPSC